MLERYANRLLAVVAAQTFTVVGDSEGLSEDGAFVGSTEGASLGGRVGDEEGKDEGLSSKAMNEQF